jgi:hypothetical protein
MEPFERLHHSFALIAGNSLVPGASSYSVGAVATVFPNEEFARKFIEENREDLEGLGIGNPGFFPVEDPWKFMRRAAGEGLAGIQSADADAPDTFMFMVRVEEAGSDLPTVLAVNSHGGIEECLTRIGVRRLSHAELLHWTRYDILDRITARWGVKRPFRAWDDGDPLYELTTDGIVVLLADVPAMGDWNSPDGAFAFFTSEQAALDYHAHRLGDGRNRMMTTGKPVADNPGEMIASLKPARVDDLANRLQELNQVWGSAAWCINPSGHREDSGFGRLWERWEDKCFRLRTVAGNWLVRSGNRFEKTDESLAWSGRDTFFWSGGQSIQLLPLDVSFGTDPIKDTEYASSMSQVETEEWVEDFLSQSYLYEERGLDLEEPSLSSFFISCWDSVSGYKYEPIPQFSGFLEALQFLSTYERENDAEFRLEGAAACSAIGFVGSGDEGHEALRGERFQKGLRSIAERHLNQEYRPSYAGDLVALANATLRTLHINFAGYAKDLLWSSETETVDELLEELGIDAEVWTEWKDGAETTIDPRGKELVIQRTGEEAWSQIQPMVKHFLSTALRHLDQQGHAPQLDYAPISIEVVKGLEVELGEILLAFRESIAGQTFDFSDNEKDLAAFLYKGKKPPSLGAISYLLRKPGANASPLIVALHHYLGSLPNSEFLTSNRFAKRDLQKVVNCYRNGGAHDSPIPEDTCRSCVEKLIGTIDMPGLIPRVIEWKARG